MAKATQEEFDSERAIKPDGKKARELREMIASKYAVYKAKNEISLKPLEEIFRKNINEYLENIEKLKLL